MKKGASISAIIVALIGLVASPFWGPPICRAVGVCSDNKPPTGAECLIGEWAPAFVANGPLNIAGATVTLTGAFPDISYRHGKAISSFGDGMTRSGTDGTHRYERTLTGSLSGGYTVEGDEIVYAPGEKNTARYVDRKDGVVAGEGFIDSGTGGRERFECTGDTLVTYGTNSAGFQYSQTWHRKAS